MKGTSTMTKIFAIAAAAAALVAAPALAQKTTGNLPRSTASTARHKPTQ